MKKRILSILLVLAMVITTFTACGGNGGNNQTQGGNENKETQGNNDEQDAGYDGSEVEVVFYNTMGANLKGVLETYIAEFNKLYPNITITSVNVGGYDDVREQIVTEISVGGQPNIAYCYPDHVALYNLAEAVATLDDLIASKVEVERADGTTEILGLTDEQIADFIPGYYKEGQQFGDDLMYTLPLSKSTEVLYYNKTFFEENGIEVPTTWEEMEEVCAKIKALDPDAIPLGYDSEANWFITMCEQLGTPYTSAEDGNHYLFDNAENHEFIKTFNSWYQKGYVTTQILLGGYTSDLFTTLDGTKSYMSIGSSAGATYQRPDAVNNEYPFEVGIATIPQADPSNPKVISQGPSLCIFEKENEQEVIASWLFVKYLTTCVEFQAEFGMTSGYVPVIQSVKDNPVYADFLASADGGNYIAALAAKVCLEQADAYYTSPAFNGSSTARDQVGSLLAKCLVVSGDVDGQIATAFEDAIDECEYSE